MNSFHAAIEKLKASNRRDCARKKAIRDKRRAANLCSCCGGERDDDCWVCSNCRYKQKLFAAGIRQ